MEALLVGPERRHSASNFLAKVVLRSRGPPRHLYDVNGPPDWLDFAYGREFRRCIGWHPHGGCLNKRQSLCN